MANQLEVTQSMVSDYENGVFRIHGDLIIKIAKVLDVSADDLLGLSKTQGSKEPIQNKRIYKKLRDIEKLPKRDQEALLRTINAFLDAAKRES
jgi:transcriptional regulator with XRE-family HTH domain